MKKGRKYGGTKFVSFYGFDCVGRWRLLTIEVAADEDDDKAPTRRRGRKV